MKTKLVLILILTATFLLINSLSRAQEPDAKNLPRLLGSDNQGTDFWFTILPVLESDGSKDSYVGIYIASLAETSVTVEVPARGFMEKKTTVPNGVIEFLLKADITQPYTKSGHDPEKAEHIYQDQAVHVHSDAPVVVYAVVKVNSNTEGFMAIPVSAIGTEYIVSSYMDMSEMYSNLNYPSLSAIVAPYDDTKVEFTLGGNQETKTAGGMTPGQTVTVTLNRGDVWAFSSKGDRADLSGSKVKATKPVSLISGNQCANIPARNKGCHYLIEMEVPTCSWGKVYHASTTPDRRLSSVLRIYAKEPETTIYRNGSQIAYLPNAGGIQEMAYIETRIMPDLSEIKSAVFSANKPIGITQYNAGTTEDGDKFLDSDPFQMALLPIDEYQKEIVFSTPAASGKTGFSQNYLNAILPLDNNGKIPSFIQFGEFVDNNWRWIPVKDKFGAQLTEYFEYNVNGKSYGLKTIALPGDGIYRLRSDEPLAAYLFGFSDYESYGYPAGALLYDLETPDTLSPVPTWTSRCDGSIEGTVTDAPGDSEMRSNMSMLYLVPDKSSNYNLTQAQFIPGQDAQVSWGMNVVDKSKEAYASVKFVDRRGNDTTIRIEYLPTILKTSPFDVNFGQIAKGRESLLHINLVNMSKKVVSVSCLELALGNKGFSIPAGQLPFELQPSATKEINVTFRSDITGEFSDILMAGDSCGCKDAASLSLSVQEPDIAADDMDFGKVLVNNESSKQISIRNNGDGDLYIIGYTGPSLGVFTAELPPASESDPVIIEPGESMTITINFQPDSQKIYQDKIIIHSNALKTDSVMNISGEGTPVGVDDNISSNNLVVYPNPAAGTAIVELPPAAGTLNIINIYGEKVKEINLNQNFDTKQQVKVDLTGLPSGVYFIEVICGNQVNRGCISVVQ